MADKGKRERRGHGSGSIYQRATDGRWVAVIDLGWIDGRRKRKYFTGHTEREVIDALNRALGDQARGVLVATGRQTVGQFLEYWLEHVVKPTVRPRTYDSYVSTVHMHLIPALGRLRLEKLTAPHVTALLNQKRESGLSATTVIYIRNVLRAALNEAMRSDLVGRNVATLVKPPARVRFVPKPLSPEEAGRLLAAAKGDRLEALYSVAVALGLRQGEALGLRWEDIDLERGVLHVRNQLQWRRDTPRRAELVEPKTERAKRSIPIPPQVVSDLKRHQRRQLEDRVLAGSRWQGGRWNLVFCSTIGTPLDYANLMKDYRALLGRAGLEPRRYHDLRHSCASFLVAQGVPPRVVMEILGHSQIGTTMNTYSHVDLDTLRAATDRMNSLFAGRDMEPEKALG
jgi:integrase